MIEKLSREDVIAFAKELDPDLSIRTLSFKTEGMNIDDRLFLEALNIISLEQGYFDEEFGSVTEYPYFYCGKVNAYIYTENEFGFINFIEYDTEKAAATKFNDLETMYANAENA